MSKLTLELGFDTSSLGDPEVAVRLASPMPLLWQAPARRDIRQQLIKAAGRVRRVRQRFV